MKPNQTIVKFKFSKGNYVTAKKLPDYHLLKGFKVNQQYQLYSIERNDEDRPERCGLFIKNKNGEIRLQDAGGNVTGHGQLFEVASPVKK